MTRTRKAIFDAILPQYDAAASAFRADRSQPNASRLQSVMLAMQCADAQSSRVLRAILANVEPSRYVQVLCTYQESV